MPRVPTYSKQVAERGLPNARVSTNAPIEAFGGGQGVANVAGAANRALGAINQFAQEEKQKADAIAATSAYNKYVTRLNDLQYNPEKGYMNRRGQNAFGVIDEYGTEADSAARDIEENELQNEEQRLLFRQNAERRRTEFTGQMQRHVYSEGKRFEEETMASAIVVSRQDAVLNYQDPGKVQTSIANQKSILQSFARANGLPLEWVAQKEREASSQTHVDVVKRMLVNHQFGAAEKYYEQTKGELDEDAALQISSAIEPRRKSRMEQDEKLALDKVKAPWDWADATGLSRAASPLDFSRENATKSFEDRSLFVAEARRKNGVNLPFAKPGEVELFIETYTRENPRNASVTFKSMGKNVPREYLGRFAQEVSKKHPALGSALMIAADFEDDARLILGGLRMMQKGENGAGRSVTLPSPRDIDLAFDAILPKQAIEDDNARISLKQAAYAHMLQREASGGVSDLTNLGKSELRKSVEKLTGETVEINGFKTMTFKGSNGEFVDEGELDAMFGALDDDTLMELVSDVPRDKNLEPINFAKSVGRLRLYTVGNGVYQIMRDGTDLALNKDGRPFRLDMKEIEKKRPASLVRRMQRAESMRQQLAGVIFNRGGGIE